MKRFLVIGDSHGRIENIERVVNSHPDAFGIIHLGDFSQDMINYRFAFTHCYVVKGNMDPLFPDTSDFARNEILLSDEGLKILIIHGHQYEAHFSTAKLLKKAMAENINLVLYGHTHRPESTVKNNVYFFNPGAMKSGSYGILVIDNKNIVEAKILTLG